MGRNPRAGSNPAPGNPSMKSQLPNKRLKLTGGDRLGEPACCGARRYQLTFRLRCANGQAPAA